MNLFLLRHGIAEDVAKSFKDFDRELTQEGKEKLQKASPHFAPLLENIDYIVSSPFVRAIQTAEIVKNSIKHNNSIIVDKKVGCGCSPYDISDIANELNANSILFVGHEPDFSETLSAFVSSSGCMLSFKKGMLAKVSFRSKARIGMGTLDFLIPLKAFLV